MRIGISVTDLLRGRFAREAVSFSLPEVAWRRLMEYARDLRDFDAEERRRAPLYEIEDVAERRTAADEIIDAAKRREEAVERSHRASGTLGRPRAVGRSGRDGGCAGRV